MKKFIKKYTAFFLVLVMIVTIGANSYTYSQELPQDIEIIEVPEVPVDPEVPIDPVEPVVPEEPVEPEEPVVPVEPVNPEEPIDPEVPVDPEVPIDPEDPLGPQTPIEPTNPSLSIEVEIDGMEYIVGDTILYTIFIANNGDVDLEKLYLQDTLLGNEPIGNLGAGEELIIQKRYEIVGDYEIEELSNVLKVTGVFRDIEIFAETSFRVSVNLGFGQPLEDIPSVEEPVIELPDFYYNTIKRFSLLSNVIADTIDVDKTAEIAQGCRAFEINLQITGTPQRVPVDVVLVIDRSGSMNETVYDYAPIASNPSNTGSYYVKINGSYQSITRHSGNIWRYGSGSNTRYVTWDPNGDDVSPGSSNSSNPIRKPFYTREELSRLYYAKRAAVNFAGKVLGPNGIPGSRISIVSFNGPGTTGVIGTENDGTLNLSFNNNLNTVVNTINGITAVNGTNTQAGFRRAKNQIINNANQNSNKVVIMFTDGMPTGSIGNPAGPNAPTSHNAHTIAAYTEGRSIYQNEIADVFTIGLFDGMTGAVKTLAIDTLTRAQNKGFYEAPTAQDLDEIFNSISENLGYAATNAVAVDKINDNFDFVSFVNPDSNDPFKSVDGKAVYNPDTHIITWQAGTIVNEKNISYKIKAKSIFYGGENVSTNDYATLTYTDVNNNPNVSKTFPVPTVYVPEPLSIILPEEIEIIIGDSVDIGGNLVVTGGYPDYYYKWTTPSDVTWISTSKNITVNPVDNTYYQIEVIDQYGCKKTELVLVRVIKGTITIVKEVEGGDDSGTTFPVYVRGDGKEWTHLAYHGSQITINNLRLGVYSISEVIPARYKLVEISEPNVKIDRDNLNITVTITNKKNPGGYFDDKDEKDNKFTVGITTTGRDSDKKRNSINLEEYIILPKEEFLQEEILLEDDNN